MIPRHQEFEGGQARPEDHFFTLVNEVIYEQFNTQSAFIGPTAAGPAEMDQEIHTQIHGRGGQPWQLLVRSRGSFPLEQLARGLARRIQEKFFPPNSDALALIRPLGAGAAWPSSKPAVDFAMVVGSTPLEVRIWKP
jgi:hypothetical protein